MINNYEVARGPVPVAKIESLESQLDHTSAKFMNYGACAVGLQMDHGVNANSCV